MWVPCRAESYFRNDDDNDDDDDDEDDGDDDDDNADKFVQADMRKRGLFYDEYKDDNEVKGDEN